VACNQPGKLFILQKAHEADAKLDKFQPANFKAYALIARFVSKAIIIL
jgi:hypothetical protein